MRKNKIFKILIIVGVLAIWKFAISDDESDVLIPVQLTGTTMGPIPYSIKYMDLEARNFQVEVDSLLEAFNNSLSTYIPSSEISRFNNEDYLEFETEFFYPVLKASKEVFENTNGAFDPTIGPLVNAWGFGPNKKTKMDSSAVDSILQAVDFEKVIFDESEVKKQNGMSLDFSAIAKGNGIDVVANYLKQKEIKDYMVEIGGEVTCKGNSPNDTLWVIGIQKPVMQGEVGGLFAKVWLENRSLATSGNYRNYYLEDGKIIAHTISPFTGYSISHNLLSASVFADNCTLADGYATACMVLGLEESKKLVDKIEGLDAFFIYNDEQGNYLSWASSGIEKYVELVY
jgi:thiamine biosynthesis lipoprotein